MSRNGRRNDRRVKVERYDRGERVDTMGTNVYSAKDNKSMHKSLNGEFLLYQVLVDRIVNGQNKSKTNESIYEYFQPEDPNDEKIMKEFDSEYQPSKAIHWYTRETCVYKILNKALRTQNISDVAAFTQFVRDLNQQLQVERKKFEKQLKSSILTVYRGQFISKDEVNRLKTTIGELLSMNSFLSTSTNKSKALEFATSRSPPNDQLTSILLEINVNIRSPCKPLADIRHLSAFAEEEEILFMFGCVFRIDDVYFDEQSNLWRAKFTLCSEGDTDLKQFQSSLSIELNGKNQLVALGNYLIQMQKYDDAEEHYLNLLDENVLTNNLDLAYCYQGLAQVYDKKENFQQAIQQIDIGLDYLSKESVVDDHPLLSEFYNQLGSIYSKLSDFPNAFHFFEKALTTKNNILHSTYQGLAQVQSQLQNYNLALEYLQKALDCQDENDFASIANNEILIGQIYGFMKEKDKASQMFDQALESQLKLLNAEHPDVAYTYLAMCSMYSDIEDYEQALHYLDKALQLQSDSLPNNHSDFALTYSSYGDIYMKQKQFDQAFVYYGKALENQLKSLLWNHPSVAKTHTTIGQVYLKQKQYEEALTYFHKVLESELDRNKSGYSSSLSHAFQRLAHVYYEKKDLEQALQFYLEFLNNELQIKLNEDLSLTDTYEIIGKIYLEKRCLASSLLYFHRLLDCYLRQRPLDDDNIQSIYSSIGKVYLKKKNFNESLLFYENNKQSQSNGKSNSNKNHLYEHIDNKHFEKRHLDQAWNYFVNYLEQQLQSLSGKDPSVGDTYQILGNIAFERKDYQQALAYFLKLLNNKLNRRKVDDSTLSNVYSAIGSIYLLQKQFHLSLIYFSRLVDCKFNKKKSFEHPVVEEAYQQIAQLYLTKHDFSLFYNSIEPPSTNISVLQFQNRHLESCLTYFHNLLHKQSQRNRSSSCSIKYSVAELYTIIGHIFVDRQDYHQALIYFQQLIYFQSNPTNQSLLSKANTLSFLGFIYSKQELIDLAIQHYKQAIQIYKKHFSNKPNPIPLLTNLIRVILIPNF